jgi:hypothetical protein
VKIVYPKKDAMVLEFAKEAFDVFKKNEKAETYSKGHVTGVVQVVSGELFAVRWNENAVLVLKLDDFFEPLVFLNADLEGGAK